MSGFHEDEPNDGSPVYGDNMLEKQCHVCGSTVFVWPSADPPVVCRSCREAQNQNEDEERESQANLEWPSYATCRECSRQVAATRDEAPWGFKFCDEHK